MGRIAVLWKSVILFRDSISLLYCCKTGTYADGCTEWFLNQKLVAIQQQYASIHSTTLHDSSLKYALVCKGVISTSKNAMDE